MEKKIISISESDLIKYWKTFFDENISEEEIEKILKDVSNTNFNRLINSNGDDYLETINSFIWNEIKNENYFVEAFEVIKRNSYWANFFEPILKKYLDELIDVLKESKIIHDNKIFLIQAISYIINQLNQVAYQTIIAELYYAKKSNLLKGNSKEERGKYFSNVLLKDNNFRKEIYVNYPELTRILDVKAKYATDFIIKIITDTDKEFYNIEKYFNKKLGKIKYLYIGEGDTHNRGKSVAKIKFDTDIVLIYKPHNLYIDKKYYKFIQWINNLKIGKSLKGKLLASKVYSINDAGWAEFIEHIECDNKKELEYFYYRIGKLLCLLHTLNGNDMHNENIIAHKDMPVLIDLETLMHPYINNAHSMESAIELSLKEVRESVTSTHLLPSKIINIKNDKILEIGGLGASKEQEAPFQGKIIENYGTDEAKIKKRYGKILPKNNNPIYKNEVVEANQYVREIIDGFKDMYIWILENKILYKNKIKDIFGDCELRVLHRATNVYAQLLFTSYHPDLLTNNMDRYVFLHRIARDYKEKNINIIKSEISELMQGDIPYFTINSNETKLNSRIIHEINIDLNKSTLNQVISKIDSMSKPRMYREISAINTSFMKEDYSGHINTIIEFQNNNENEIKKEYLLEKVFKIADYILQRSITGKKNGISSRIWMQSSDIGLGFRVFDNVGIDLYSGLSGIALFYNYLWKVSNESKYKDVVEEIIVSIEEMLSKNKELGYLKNMKIGAFNGLSGVVYTLFYIDYSNNSSMHTDKILELLEIISKNVESIESRDIINSVGTLGIMISIYEKTQNNLLKIKSLEICNKIFDSLNNKKNKFKHTKGISWSDKGYVGYSHGNSGVIAQLYRLYNITNDIRIINLIEEALLYEKSMYSYKEKNWYKSIDEKKCLCGWCHGAPGILFSKIQLKKFGFDYIGIDNEIELAIQKTIESGLKNDISLCHGDMGNMVILKEAALVLKDKKLYSKSLSTIKEIVNFISNLIETESFKENEHNEFMIGLTGIAYEILRIGREDEIPNVLGLE